MDKKNPVPNIEVHQRLNPFMGKTFKVATYDSEDNLLKTEEVSITSQEELKAIIDGIKVFNEEVNPTLKKKLITETK